MITIERSTNLQLFTDSNIITVMKRYSEILAHNPRVAISPMDLDISAKCEKLLMTEPTFADLNGSVGKIMIHIYLVYLMIHYLKPGTR